MLLFLLLLLSFDACTLFSSLVFPSLLRPPPAVASTCRRVWPNSYPNSHLKPTSNQNSKLEFEIEIKIKSELDVNFPTADVFGGKKSFTRRVEPSARNQNLELKKSKSNSCVILFFTGEAFGGRVPVVRCVEPSDQPEGQSAPHAHHYPGLPRHELQLQRRRAADAPDQRGWFWFMLSRPGFLSFFFFAPTLASFRILYRYMYRL